MLTANEARVIKNDYLLFQVLEQIKKMAMQGESKVYFFTEEIGEPSEKSYSGIIKLNDKMVDSLKELGYKIRKTEPSNWNSHPFWEVSF